MESLRSLIGMKPKDTTTDEDIFVEEITALLKPHLTEAVTDYTNEIYATPVLIGEESTRAFERVNEILLHKFFKLAKASPELGKFMFPIMMYLRKARAERAKVSPKV